MCCHGCQAVAQTIVASGLDDFYRYRDVNSPTGREVVPTFLDELQVFDNPAVQKSFVHGIDAELREASLILEGIVCAACVWLNEKHIAALPGVVDVSINYSNRRARVRWDESQIHLSDILAAISQIGYHAHPYDPNRQQQVIEQERRQMLRQLGLAAVLGMQVMILAVALYFGDWSGMESDLREFFSWLALILTTPVLLYSARPFYTAALRDLRHGRAGMDVPVALGISVAFLASIWSILSGQGDVYFDSVVMFVFFLLSARYLELMARKRASESSEALVKMTPMMANRLLPDGNSEVIPAVELATGDRVRILPGDTVPADGMVLTGSSSVDESLLSGESLPVRRQQGDVLIGGSVNVESVLEMEVTATGENTRLSSILRLLDRAQTEKPTLARMADRIAAYFVSVVLLLAVSVAGYWYLQGNMHWLSITIAVLVVTCPCALSLATPAAVTAATGRLTRQGLLVTRGHVLEHLASATHVVLDKTGTLTRGCPALKNVQTFADLNAHECLNLAAALEQHSEHPLGKVIQSVAEQTLKQATEVVNIPGSGVAGQIEGVPYMVGSPAYIKACTDLVLPDKLDELQADGSTVVILASQSEVLAAFVMGDQLRPEAKALVADLKQRGLQVHLYTGDHAQAAQAVADLCGIDTVAWSLSPEDKLARVHQLQDQGYVVVMVGDGVNDAPVLAGAQVSVAMGGGTALALASADMVLLSNNLSVLEQGFDVARQTLNIIRQNMLWAIAYNVTAIPAAAMGLILPWMAALGMSLSSLLVVFNALRLTRQHQEDK
jgi:Cu2+-exporting ATPase